MSDFNIETVAIDTLRPHPRNYRAHPQAQIEHLEASLREYGWARNVVVSSDNVILAGHGIVEAALRNGHTEVPVHRLDLPSTHPKAEKFLVLENEVSRLAQDDDTQLAALLADIQRTEGLDGTGWDGGTLDELLGNLDQHAFADGEELEEGRKAKLDRQWFVGFVLDQDSKDKLAEVIDTERREDEKPHQTLARLVAAKLVCQS